MKKCFVALVMLTFAFVGTGEAQMGTGRVTGTVTDTDGNPIAGAHIVAETKGSGHKIEATSDEKGRWAAMGFRGGRWTFTVSAEGYAPMADTLSIKGLGKNPPVNVVLEKIRKGRATKGANVLLNEANELYRQKNYDGALAKYQQLIEENPTLYQIHLNIGNVYREKGDLDSAIEEYKLVLQDAPAETLALVSVGDILVKKGEHGEAVGYFEKAVASNPTDEVLPFNVAELCFNTGEVDKAIEYYQKSADIKPDWSEPYLKMGYAYLNLGKMDEAAEQFKKVVEVAPDSQEAQQAQSVLDSLGK